MFVGVQHDATMAAASSGCSSGSGCQSGWTTYLEDDHNSSYSCGTAPLHGNGKAQQPCYGCDDDYSEEAAEEDDLSMISDASSGPRQQYSAGSDEGGAAARANAHAERRGRRAEPAARRQSKMAAVASLLEDTASSPASFKYSKVMSSPEAHGYGSSTMEIGNGNEVDFSCAFSVMTGFKSPLNGFPLGRYLQVQYSPAPVKPMPSRQVCRDGGEKIKRYR